MEKYLYSAIRRMAVLDGPWAFLGLLTACGGSAPQPGPSMMPVPVAPEIVLSPTSPRVDVRGEPFSPEVSGVERIDATKRRIHTLADLFERSSQLALPTLGALGIAGRDDFPTALESTWTVADALRYFSLLLKQNPSLKNANVWMHYDPFYEKMAGTTASYTFNGDLEEWVPTFEIRYGGPILIPDNRHEALRDHDTVTDLELAAMGFHELGHVGQILYTVMAINGNPKLRQKLGTSYAVSQYIEQEHLKLTDAFNAVFKLQNPEYSGKYLPNEADANVLMMALVDALKKLRQSDEQIPGLGQIDDPDPNSLSGAYNAFVLGGEGPRDPRWIARHVSLP